jgi:hypothetical protein
MGPDISLYVDRQRSLFVQSVFSLQPIAALNLIQAEEIQVGVQFLDLTGNGLAPFVNVDPTGWTLQFGVGYVDSTGTKQLISLATTTALTAISGISAQTSMLFGLNLATTAAATLLNSVRSSPIWAEISWNPNSANTGYVNKVQTPGTIKTGFLGVGLPSPT